MSYSQLIERLFHVNLFGGMKLGLDNCHHLQELLDFPDRKFASIHIAGTNGKGSVTTKIAHGLQAAGYKVGLYTSPHIACFRERIRINGEMIPEPAVVSILSRLFALTEKEHIPATFFEITTFLAFLYFAQEKIDIAVLETGLGGRLDATNIVSPLLSVITSISLDHTETLGKTIEAIAQQKAGIIKPCTPVIIGPQVPYAIIKAKAEEQQSPCLQIAQSFEEYEQENRALAKAALEHLAQRLQLSDTHIGQGLEGGQPCRFERVLNDPVVILDVAHNPDGLMRLFQSAKKHFPQQSFRVVFGLSKSKDVKGCLEVLATFGSDFHLVEALNGRGAPVTSLKEGLEELKVDAQQIFINQDIQASVKRAIEQARHQNQVLIICGSFFIMSHARQALGIHEPIDELDMNERSAAP